MPKSITNVEEKQKKQKIDFTKKKNINIRISLQQEKEWEDYRKAHRFPSLSSFVRWCVEEEILGKNKQKIEINRLENLEKRLEYLEKKKDDENREIRQLIKIITLKGRLESDSLNNLLREYQKNTLVRLVRQSPKNEKELGILLELPEVITLGLINELLLEGRIAEFKSKYKEV